VVRNTLMFADSVLYRILPI